MSSNIPATGSWCLPGGTAKFASRQSPGKCRSLVPAAKLHQGRPESRGSGCKSPSFTPKSGSMASPSPRGGNNGTPSGRGKNARRRPAWQSLADWHRQVAASPEGRRLNVWQLEFYSRPSSLQENWSQCLSSAEDTRPSSHMSVMCSTISELKTLSLGSKGSRSSFLTKQQQQYPLIPPLPACHLARRSGSRSVTPRQKHVWTPRQPSDEGFADMAEGAQLVSVTDAVVALSCGVLQPRWRCSSFGSGWTPSDSSDRTSASASGAPHQRRASPLLRAAVGQTRRLELTLRGTFRDSSWQQLDEVHDAEDHAGGQRHQRLTRVDAGYKSPDSLLRERMGFGRGEASATPSGRTSVPAIRPDGQASSFALPSMGMDEGIELESLASGVEHHVRKVIERCLRGESSRAPSCELGSSRRASSCEPIMEHRCLSPLLGHCSVQRGQSPCFQTMNDEPLSLCITARLRRSRCGTSSAVLELSLGHGIECRRSRARECRCRPSPEDAEVLISSHFARHSLLRLNARLPPVQVAAEVLPEIEVEE